MSTAQKRGFRLPWSSDRDPTDMDPEEDAQRLAAFLQAASGTTVAGNAPEELGDGPFQVTPETETGAESAAPDAGPETVEEPVALEQESDVAAPDATVEPAWPQADQVSEAVVLESVVQDGAATPNAEELTSSEPVTASTAAGWPTADLNAAPTPADEPVRPPTPAAAPKARRDNPLVMGLVRAMREAAESSRGEAVAALQSEAAAQVEAIKARATDDAAALRTKADDDMTAIREWAKAETARIRHESEQRINNRREAQTRELEEHAAVVAARIAEVEAAVVAYEAEMDRFFAELLAETDPGKLATLAERAPEPPDLAELPGVRSTAASNWYDAAAVDAPAESATEGPLGQEDAAAAEAEALGGLVQLPDVDGAELVGGDEDGTAVTALVVEGLTTVAGISAFKGVLGQLPGVEMVSVSAGEPGTFVFSVAHDEDTDLRVALPGLAGFGARVTADEGLTLQVSAHEPAA